MARRRGKEYKHLLTGRRPASLCWYCANAVPCDKTGCNWSRKFEPVDGWDAVITDSMHRNELGADSLAHGKHAYLVKDCPEFIPSTAEFQKAQMRYGEGLEQLALDVIKTAVIDFIPKYSDLLAVRMKRGYRFVVIDDKIIKMHIPHKTEMHKRNREIRRAIRKRVDAENLTRMTIYKGIEMYERACENAVRRGLDEIAAMRIPGEDRERAVYYSFLDLYKFFTSDYAFSLSEVEPAVLMRKVMRQVEEDHDIPMMESIIRPSKKLKKGIRYGTGR